MNYNKLITLFLISKNKSNKQGKCPLRCRLTYDGKRKIFSTGLFINPEHWDSTKQNAHPPNEENNYINSQLSLITNKVNQAFLFLEVQKGDFDVEDIYNQYAGVATKKEHSILEMFNLHIAKQEKLIGISTTKVSVAKFYQTKKHVSTFIQFRYKKKDFLLKDMKMSFINDFEHYLRAEKRFLQNTIYKTIQRFRQVIKIAVGLDYLDKDPFLLHKNTKPKKKIVFLSPEELEKLENYHFTQSRLQMVKDLFIFCCYTGLAYQEMDNLKKDDIYTSFNKHKWIRVNRQKTGKEYSVPLLSKAEAIINKYQNNDQLLPKISNQRFNSYLKEIADIVDINKKLTHHIARKTFATTVLLYNDVPMEIVSESLGHSNISITQEHYAKVVQKKMGDYFDKVENKLRK